MLTSSLRILTVLIELICFTHLLLKNQYAGMVYAYFYILEPLDFHQLKLDFKIPNSSKYFLNPILHSEVNDYFAPNGEYLSDRYH